MYREKQRGQATSAWYMPGRNLQETGGVRPETIHVGELSHTEPTWEDAVYDVKKAREAAADYAAGKIDYEEAMAAPYTDEWQGRFSNWFSEVQKMAKTYEMSPYRVAAGGKITSDDHSTLNIVNIMAEILGRDTREYVLVNAATRASTPNLRLSIDTFNGFDVERDVPEGAEPLAQKGRMTRQDFTVPKQVSHIVQTDESELTSDRNLMQEHIRHAASKMNRLKALLVATVLENSDPSPTAGSDWAAYTTDHSTANPGDQIGALQDIIDDNGGVGDTVASGTRAYRDFIGNTHNKGMVNPTPGAGSRSGKVVTNPGNLLDVDAWYVDRLITNTLAIVYDKSAVLFLQGPIRTETYRDSLKGQNGWITRDWCASYCVDTTRVKELTGVSA